MTSREPTNYVCKCSACGDAITAMPREPVSIPSSWVYCLSHGWFCHLCVRIRGLEVCEKKGLSVRYDFSGRKTSVIEQGGWFVGRPNGQEPPDHFDVLSPTYHKPEQAYGWAIENVSEVSNDSD